MVTAPANELIKRMSSIAQRLSGPNLLWSGPTTILPSVMELHDLAGDLAVFAKGQPELSSIRAYAVALQHYAAAAIMPLGFLLAEPPGDDEAEQAKHGTSVGEALKWPVALAGYIADEHARLAGGAADKPN